MDDLFDILIESGGKELHTDSTNPEQRRLLWRQQCFQFVDVTSHANSIGLIMTDTSFLDNLHNLHNIFVSSSLPRNHSLYPAGPFSVSH